MASHIGAAQLNPDPYNLGDEEIREIAKRGGAIGVIFMTYWLDREHPKNGLEPIWKTIEHIHDVTGSWDHIVLGTDFDGFTDPPDDLRDASSMGSVTRLLLERGVSEVDVAKVLGGNAQRVLAAGWR
jgi:membrane dipeptidase